MYFLWLKSGEGLMQEKPECREQIAPILSSLQEQWDELEGTTKSKAERLFDANRAVIYQQSCDDIDGWIEQLETQIITAEEGARDLTTVNLLMQKQHVSKSRLHTNWWSILNFVIDERKCQSFILCSCLFHQQLESQMKIKEGQVAELDEQAVILRKVDPHQESMIEARKALVAER